MFALFVILLLLIFYSLIIICINVIKFIINLCYSHYKQYVKCELHNDHNCDICYKDDE